MMIYNAFFLCPDLKKKKKKDWLTDPPDFQAKKGKQPFIFLGLIYSLYQNGW